MLCNPFFNLLFSIDDAFVLCASFYALEPFQLVVHLG